MPEYYLVNTNMQNRAACHHYMLEEERAAAFYDPWKHNIDPIKKGDVVFLYQSVVGIVAVGRASGKIEVKPFGKGEEYEADGEHSQKLLGFTEISPPITARVIRAISQDIGGANVILRPTVVHLRTEAGQAIFRLATGKRAP